MILGSGDQEQSSDTTISVNKLTNDPDKAWDKLKNKVTKQALNPLSLDTPVYDNKVILGSSLFSRKSSI